MNGYDGGYRSRGRTPGWADPRGGYGEAMDRERRPWTGGYGGGYQGGSGGYRTGGPRERGGEGGGDYWWMGERAYPRDRGYDPEYRRFDRENRPQYSPIGGMYHAMGGEYRYGRPPRPLREDTWFSDWTRWF